MISHTQGTRGGMCSRHPRSMTYLKTDGMWSNEAEGAGGVLAQGGDSHERRV